MDEHKLAGAFRDAVRETPPASFDATDVVAASHRVTARRRMQLAGGSALGVVVLAGGLVLGNSTLGDGGHPAAPMAGGRPSTSGQARVFTAQGEPNPRMTAPGNSVNPNSLPGQPPKQGSGESGMAGQPTGNPRPGCGSVDRELAAALAGELPAIAGSPPIMADGPCPAGARAVAVAVRDGASAGTLTVVLVPAPNSGRAGPDAGPAAVVASHSGGTLTVSSRAAAGSSAAPYTDQVGKVATDLATHF